MIKFSKQRHVLDILEEQLKSFPLAENQYHWHSLRRLAFCLMWWRNSITVSSRLTRRAPTAIAAIARGDKVPSVPTTWRIKIALLSDVCVHNTHAVSVACKLLCAIKATKQKNEKNQIENRRYRGLSKLAIKLHLHASLLLVHANRPFIKKPHFWSKKGVKLCREVILINLNTFDRPVLAFAVLLQILSVSLSVAKYFWKIPLQEIANLLFFKLKTLSTKHVNKEHLIFWTKGKKNPTSSILSNCCVYFLPNCSTRSFRQGGKATFCLDGYFARWPLRRYYQKSLSHCSRWRASPLQ